MYQTCCAWGEAFNFVVAVMNMSPTKAQAGGTLDARQIVQKLMSVWPGHSVYDVRSQEVRGVEEKTVQKVRGMKLDNIG